MATVSEGHTVGVQASGHADDLVAHANTEDGLVPLLDGLAQLQGSLHALLGVARAVGKEEPVELVTNAVEVVVPGEDGDGGVAADKGASDVRFGSKVEEGDLDITGGVEGVDFLGRDLVDKVFEGGIPVLVCLGRGEGHIIANDKTAEGGSLVTEKGRDSSGINTSDTRDIVPLAPGCKRFDSLVVGETIGNITNDNTSALDALGLENNADVLAVEGCLVVGHTIVADHWGSENEDLPTVRWVSHGFGVCKACQQLLL